MENNAKERAKKILEKFQKARERRQHKDAKWRELVEFYRGEQWDKSGKIPPWIPKPVTNYIHLVTTTKRAAFAIENPIGMLRPLSAADEEAINKLQRIYEYEWKHVKARKYVREAIETGKLLGTGIVQVYFDDTIIGGGTGTMYEGEVRMRHIDPATFYPDPTAHTLEDCQFVHIVERKSIEWLKKHPIFGPKMKNVQERKVSDNERGEIYSHSGNASFDGMIDFHTHYEKIPNTWKDETGEPIGGFRYRVTYMAGEHIVHEIENLLPAMYPFAIYYDYPQRQDFWGKSTAELVLDNQKLINKIESIMALIGTQLQNPQRIVHKMSGIDPRAVAKYGHAPGHVFVSNMEPSRAMTWATPPEIPPALFNLAERARENIREITGITQSYMGETVGSLQTSSGVRQLIERATMRDRDQMFDVELFIEDLTRLFIAYITHHYTEERYIRVTQDYGEEYLFEEYVGSEFNGLNFDFEIDVTAQAPVTRQRMQEELERLLQYQGQYGHMFDVNLVIPEDVINYGNFADKGKMLARMKRERIVNRTQLAFEVASMMAEALQGGVPPEEVQKMGMAMLEQREEQLKKGIGSANTGQHQMSQGAIG